jgi:GxxExxY protein
MVKIVEGELSYLIVSCCFQVHKELGRFVSERQYTCRLAEVFAQRNIKFVQEKDIKNLNHSTLTGNIPDFLIEERVILDLKAKPFITKEDYYQMQRYLRAANLELGIIINFRAYRLTPKRVLNGSLLKH